MRKLKLVGIIAFTICALINPIWANAANDVYTVDVQGYYRSPVDGQIEDSGGDSQEALGQSMVDSVVDTTGLLEELSDGSYALYVRFNLMDNISDVSFSVMSNGGTSWKSISYDTTGSTSETTDFYIPLPSKDSFVRAECYVTAMGRSVIFYMGYSNLKAGNSTDIALVNRTSKTVSDEDNSVTSTDVDSKESATDSLGTGLTIGYADDDSQNDDAIKEDEADQDTIGDSVWVLLFLVVFSATFLAGLLLILVFSLVRKAQITKEEIRIKNLRRYDEYQYEDLEDEEMEFVEDVY